MKRYFELSTHALVITAFTALAMTGRLDAASVILFGAGVLWSLYRTCRQRPALLDARSTFVLSSVYIVFFFVDSIALSHSFIPATVHMVLFLELAKLYEEKSDKDYFYLIVLAFLMVLAAASLTIDISFVITLFLFLISLVATLMSFEIVRSQRLGTAETRTVAVSLTGISGWATVWIVAIGVVLFFLIPRMGTGYFSRATVPPVLQSGFSDNVRLGEIGQIKLSSAIVMRAKRASGRPSSGLKWRGIALDRFDGRAWHKAEYNRDEIHPDVTNDVGNFSIRPLEHPGDAVRYDILQEPLATATLFGPYHVRSVTGRLDGILVDDDESVFTRVQQQRRIQYQVLSEIPNRSDPPVNTPLADPAPYLQLPRNLDPRVVELARAITADANSPFEKASLIEAYLRKNYRYTLNLTWEPGTQPLNTFLFEAKTGHCEYFASAMAILARAAGIPTRLVNGFQMGEFNPIGSDYIVRESDAHSWVEAYVADRGWVEFDATPPDLRPPDTDLRVQLSHYVDAMELVWNSYVLVYDSDSQSQLFHSAQDRIQKLQVDFRTSSDTWSARARELGDGLSRKLRRLDRTADFWVLLLLGACVAAALYQWRSLRAVWKIWKIRSGRGSASSDVIEHLFLRAARLAGRRKPSRLAVQTWREWVIQLPDADRRSILLRAIGVFEKSKYGRDPVSAAEFTVLENAIRELHALKR